MSYGKRSGNGYYRSRRQYKWLIVLVIAVIAYAGSHMTELKQQLGITDNTGQTGSVETVDASDLNEATVERVVDGDTFVVTYQGESQRLRLIGVDTPESVNPTASKNTEAGKIASNYTKSQFNEGQTIYLEFDAQQTDKYGRLLAYVYKDSAGKDMYNKDLLTKGYARTMTIQPNSKYANEFAELQTKARESNAGFWSEDQDTVYAS